MACQTYSFRWSTTQSTVENGGGTVVNGSFTIAGSVPALNDNVHSNATCSSSGPGTGGVNYYVAIDDVSTLRNKIYTVDGSFSANNGKIIAINDVCGLLRNPSFDIFQNDLGTCASPCNGTTGSTVDGTFCSRTSNGQYTFYPQECIPYWNTTAPDSIMEVWGNNYQSVPAYDGTNFIEINASSSASQALYQTFSASIGTSYQLQFAHRGRNFFLNTMQVGLSGSTGINFFPIEYTGSTTQWNLHAYGFTASESEYNLIFSATSSQNGGNFLDAIDIVCSSEFITPSPTPSGVPASQTPTPTPPNTPPVTPTISLTTTPTVSPLSLYLSGCTGGTVYQVIRSSWMASTTGTVLISGDTNIPDGCYTFIAETSHVGPYSFNGTATTLEGGCSDPLCPTECDCKYISVQISQTDLDAASDNSDPADDGRVTLVYTGCGGTQVVKHYNAEGTYTDDVCALLSTIPNSLLYYKRNDAIVSSKIGSSYSTGKCCSVVPITQTPTPTVTPTISDTPTPTPTYTPTFTPSVTPTNTPTVSVSDTPSVTPTNTPTVSVSDTPSVTPTNTPTVSVSDTPGSSSTPTPTISDTPSVTPTNTPTVTVSDTTGTSATPPPTPSITPTLPPTNTITDSPSHTPGSSSTPTPTISDTPSVTPTYTPTYTPSVTTSVTPTNTVTPTPSTSGGEGNCVQGVTDGTYYYTDCCGFYRSGQSVGEIITLDTTQPYNGISVNGTPATQDCNEGDLDYNFSVTGTCDGANSGVITIAPFAGVPPYTIDNILPGTLAGGTSNEPFTWTGLSAGTYTFRLNDSLGDANNELYINVNVDGCLNVTIDDYSGTTCGAETGYISISGDSTSLPYLIDLYKDGLVYSNLSSPNNPTIFTNLPNGEYYAYVEDFGGATGQTQTVTISGVSSLDFGLAVTGTSACGVSVGSIQVTGLTGSSPYTYLWSNGATGDTISNLIGGTYSVTVTDSNNCELTKSATITTC